MPIHDWTRVDAGLFHAFHQGWIIRLSDSRRTPVSYRVTILRSRSRRSRARFPTS